MTWYLLDTGIAQDYIQHRAGVYLRAQQRRALGHRIGICTPVLGELWAGIEGSHSVSRNRQRLIRNLASLKCWPFDQAAAREFGRVAALLRRMGRPIQQIDLQIAAVALRFGNCTVVSKDSDFRVIPGLAVEDWSIP
jgi:tRNA(fMet)-specific endonuclease VapC